MSKTITHYINTQKSRIRVFAVFVFTVLFISACGKVDSSGSSATPTPTPDPTRTIAFTSASASTISIAAAGSDTQAVLTFTVSANGSSVSGAEVDFSINDSDGTGATITSATSSISAADGTVTVTIQSANTAGNITVTATIAGSTTAATSSQLSIIGLSADKIEYISASTLTLDLLGSGGTDQATLTFWVTNIGNVGIRDVNVAFTIRDLQGTGATLVNTSGTSAINGLVTVTVNSGSSEGDIAVTATIVGTSLSSTSKDITVTDLATDQITFVSTTTDTLAFRDSGGIDQARLVFNISDETGQPLSGVSVAFSVNDPGGTGISLANPSAVSDTTGNVSAVVQSGTIPSVFSVVATVNASTTISSPPLIVTAGLPVEHRFSLSANPLNTANAHDVDGITATITVIASDILGNPIPDGTEIRFISEESGTITPSCKTADNGTCTVTWTSASPRPSNGRFTVLAFVNGIERFTDNNGNGVYDFSIDSFNVADDVGEPFSDNNENDSYDLGEFFFPVNGDGIRNSGDGIWTTGNVVVFKNIVLTLSNDSPIIYSTDFTEGSSIDVTQGTQTLNITLSDSNNNPLPIGTNITYSANNGTIIGTSAYTVLNTGARQFVPVTIAADSTPGSTNLDLFLLTVTTPDGTVKTFTWRIYDGVRINSSTPAVTTGTLDVSTSNDSILVTLSPLPIGTTMTYTTDNGNFTGTSSYTVSSNGTNYIPVELTSDGVSSTGKVTLTVTTPPGSVTTFQWNIDD